MGIAPWENYLKSLGLAKADERQVLDQWGIGTNRFPQIVPVWRGSERKTEDGKPLGMWGTWAYEPTYAAAFYHPLANAETVAEVEAHPWPDPAHYDFTLYLDHLKKDTHLVRKTNPCWTPVFCTLSSLFGMDRALLNMHENPALIEAALAYIDRFYIAFFQRQLEVCGGHLEVLSVGDDFAEQRQLLMRPEHWRRFFKPLYAKYFAMGKARGLKTWMHACGACREVLPDLIDIGLDIWETVQTHLPGNEPAGLKRDFGRHLVFAGGVNTQQVLWRATPAEVRRHTHDMIRALGKGGGYICGPDHWIQPEVPYENIGAVFEAVAEFRGEGCTL
jgi:uroporphyrinogen decarboxylase